MHTSAYNNCLTGTTNCIVRVFGVNHREVGPGVPQVSAPLQYDMHVPVVGARLGVLPPALGKSQQRAFGGKEERRNSETVVVQISSLVDDCLEDRTGTFSSY